MSSANNRKNTRSPITHGKKWWKAIWPYLKNIIAKKITPGNNCLRMIRSAPISPIQRSKKFEGIMQQQVNNPTGGRFYYPAILLLMLVFTGMRLVHINADAPQDLSISAALYTDEGFKTYEPCNMVIFGD